MLNDRTTPIGALLRAGFWTGWSSGVRNGELTRRRLASGSSSSPDLGVTATSDLGVTATFTRVGVLTGVIIALHGVGFQKEIEMGVIFGMI
jgi:hypothetical protein